MDGGVYRSTDDGANWMVVGLPGTPVYSVATAVGGHLFAGTGGSGIFRSIDDGGSWTQVNGSLTNTVTSLAVNADGRIFAGVFGDGVLVSSDDGGTWTPSNIGLTNLGIHALAIRGIGSIYAGTPSGVFRAALNSAPTSTTVTNTNNSGVGSLRDAIAIVAPGGTIDFSLPLPATITLTTGELLINKDLTISGPGASSLAISGNNSSRVFNIASGSVAISGLTVRNGWPDLHGGGIYNNGTLTLINSTLSGNSTPNGGSGGGIFNTGTLTLTNSTLSDNFARSGGGAICNAGTLTVTNSIFSGNSAANGGGIYNPGGPATLTNSTSSTTPLPMAAASTAMVRLV